MSIKPKLGLFDLTMIIVSLVIGVGIFRSPAIVAQKAGSEYIFFAAWILGGLVSICGALTFAEIGSRYPVAGGFYKVFSHCYHPAYAFMLNWSLVIINAASNIGVALVGSEYICSLFFPAGTQVGFRVKLVAAAITLLLYLVNMLGIRMGALAQNLLSLLKIGMILIFCAAVLLPAGGVPAAPAPLPAGSFGFLKALGVSLIAVFFTYGGYQNTINFGADIRYPSRNIPKGIAMGMGIVIFVYLAINLAYCRVLGFAAVQQSKLLAADLAGVLLGPAGKNFASVAIFISVLGFMNTSLLSNPRVYYAMAEDGILPGWFSRINPRSMAQEFGLSFFVALMLFSLLLLGTFEKIVDYVMFIDSLSLASAAGTIFLFRRRARGRDDEPGIFRLKFYPLVPVVFMTVMAFVMANVLVTDTLSAMYGIIIFLAGYPLFLILKRLLATKQA